MLQEQVARANALSVLRTVESYQYGFWSDNDKLASTINELGGDNTIKALAAALYAFDPTPTGEINGWPSEAALAGWEKIERLTPQRGVAKARGLARSVGKLN